MPKFLSAVFRTKAVTFLALITLIYVVFPSKAYAVTAKGRWDVAGASESGSVKFTFPADGGSTKGEFSGGGSADGVNMQYGGRFSGTFSGGWDGRFNGTFFGWVQITYYDPISEENVTVDRNVGGPWDGSINHDGTGHAYFHNEAAGGLSGSASFTFSKSAFEREYGEAFVDAEAKKALEEFEKEEKQAAEAAERKKANAENDEEIEEVAEPTWEEQYLADREEERVLRRRGWFRERYTPDRYSQSTRDDDYPNFWERGMFSVVEKAEKANDKITVEAIKVLNAIEAEFLKAFGDKDPT